MPIMVCKWLTGIFAIELLN